MERRNIGSFNWMFLVVLVFALGLLGWGIYLAVESGHHTILATGAACVVVTLLAWLLAINNSGAAERAARQQETFMAPVNERLQQMSVLLNQIGEQQLISERAKAIAFRESERDAMRRAIREEMARKDWDAAMMMANDIESVFGYKQEADRFREEIRVQREGETRKAVAEGMGLIDKYCRAEQWTQALREAERLMQQYAHDPQSQRLGQEIESRRQGHKKQLMETWQDAVSRHDVDGSIEILKRLDLYLTPQEAEAMQETARQVFKDKLLLLGQQFTLAVKDHNWQDAMRLGDNIVREFPNSRMAQEVRDKMELLKTRAGEQQPARV